MATKTRKYKKVSCHTTVTAARKAAKTLQNKGQTASVRRTKNGACVWSGGKRKIATIKATGQKLSGTRRKRRATKR